MQTHAPDEGPSRGGPSASSICGRPATKHSGVEERSDTKLLRAVAKKNDIDSITSLVAAYNAATDKDERAVLFGWLSNYNKRSEKRLSPESALDYSELAKVRPHSIQDKAVLRSVVRNLCSSLCGGEFLERNLAVALHRALARIDPSAYRGVSELLDTAKKLLNSISAIPTLRRENFSDYEALFLALQIFFMLHQTNQKSIYEEEKQDLRKRTAEKEGILVLSCKYYPLHFHFSALRQAIERLNIEDVSSHVAQAKLCLSCGLRVFLDVFHCVRKLAGFDIDPTSTENAVERGRMAVNKMGMMKREWYDWLRDLMKARQQALGEEAKLGSFVDVHDEVINKQRRTRQGDQKALRYGIIQEMRLLAIQGSYQGVRKEATKKLRGASTKTGVCVQECG